MHYVEKQWKKLITKGLSFIFHDDKREVSKFVDYVFKRDYQDTDCMIYNNYDNEIIDTSLAKTVDWMVITKPLITESGVFFKQKKDQRNPKTELIEGRIWARKAIQKSYRQSNDPVDRDFLNSKQGSKKTYLNSGYGIQSEKRSFDYSLHIPISITSAARSQISISTACTENFFSDFVKFMNMDEFYSYVLFLSDEFNERKKTDNYTNYKEVIPEDIKINRLLRRMKDKFKYGDKFNVVEAKEFLMSFSAEFRTRLYYKCNISQFLYDSPIMRQLYQSMMDSSTVFVDPNDAPEEIKEELALFCLLADEFVQNNHIPFRYEDRNIVEMRNVIIVEDTDSNIIYYGENLDFIEKHILRKFPEFDNYDAQFEYEQKEFNILSVAHSKALRSGLDAYLDKVNTPKDERFWINMKNEFYMNTVVTTESKKAYISNIQRQESEVFKTPQLDTKGVSFYKSTSTENMTNFINNEILIDEILSPADGRIDIKRIMKKINRQRNQIITDLRTGDMGYFSKSLKVKNFESYDSPMSISGFKAVYVWNHLADKEEQIHLPAFISLIKVNLFKKANLAALEEYPEICEKLMWLMDEIPEFKKSGIRAIAVPAGTEVIPEWMLNIIDTESITNQNMSLISQIFGPLDMVPGVVRHNNVSMKHYSSILRL